MSIAEDMNFDAHGQSGVSAMKYMDLEKDLILFLWALPGTKKSLFPALWF